MKYILPELEGIGYLGFQRAYISEHQDPHPWSKYPGLDLQVCKHFVSGKSSVDVHLIVDAMNLKWTAADECVDTIAIASRDSDFAVVAEDIRASTGLEVYAVWPAFDGSPLNVASSFTQVIYYGGKPKKGLLDEKQEAALWATCCELGYVTASERKTWLARDGQNPIVQAKHLDVFCYAHGLPWPKVAMKKWRESLAASAHAKLTSGDPLVCKPEHVFVLYAVTVTGGGNERTDSGRTLVLDTKGMDPLDIAHCVLEFLGVASRRRTITPAMVEEFFSTQRHFSRGVQLDDTILGLDIAAQVEYLAKLFTEPSQHTLRMWVRRSRMKAVSLVRTISSRQVLPIEH